MTTALIARVIDAPDVEGAGRWNAWARSSDVVAVCRSAGCPGRHVIRCNVAAVRFLQPAARAPYVCEGVALRHGRQHDNLQHGAGADVRPGAEHPNLHLPQASRDRTS